MSNEDFNPGGIEIVPDKLDVVVDFLGGRNLLEDAGGEPQRLSVCVDMGGGKMYVGDGHVTLLRKYNIPLDQYCKVIVDVDGYCNITVPYAFDMRGMKPKTIQTNRLKNLVVETLRRYLDKPKTEV